MPTTRNDSHRRATTLPASARRHSCPTKKTCDDPVRTPDRDCHQFNKNSNIRKLFSKNKNSHNYVLKCLRPPLNNIVIHSFIAEQLAGNYLNAFTKRIKLNTNYILTRLLLFFSL
ncbi:hypothetical protein V8G54_019593 [Vigna mungo]|uniref:Uncharacterized protein n=1 Tax=Vigna mungo TaxID=3915 RepID=A0AAQ3NBX6_VIGMU